MSAFIVGSYHINRIVATALHGPRDKAGHWYRSQHVELEPRDLGQMLHDANVRSVSYCYQRDDPAKSYQYSRLVERMTAVEALKALDCYEYQSCELPDWQGSPAQQWCERFRAGLIRVLLGYEEAPWTQTPAVAS
ncbi:MAG: hypothetical protein AB7R89_28720 [Dehalococcoidia bacterium]